jgi:putative ABC transport system substrate-binding protein
MQRREFVTLLGGAVAAWPFAIRAQQPERMRRIGILLPATADDAKFQNWVTSFLQVLQQSGWTIGGNLQIDTRWATANAAAIRKQAAELVALAPDVILAHGSMSVGPSLEATHTVPIVFPVAADPVGAGFVNTLARPGGNATGFMNFEYGMGVKWLELLKEIAPGVRRVAVLRDTSNPTGIAMFGVIQAVAPSFRVELTPVNIRDKPEIERAIAAFGHPSNGGLVVTPSGSALRHRDLIVALPHDINCPQSISNAPILPSGAWSPTGPILSTSIGKRPPTLIASSRVRSRPTCQCRHQPRTNW